MADFKETISRNRTFIMGCAMISILFFHQWFIEGGVLGKVWLVFKWFGHWGVDVFLFLSGFGIAHSLRKNSLKTYYRNRIERIVPTCLIAGFALGLLHILVGFGGPGLYGNASLFCIFTSLWLWYIYAILIYYAVAPLLLKGIDKWGWWMLVGAAVLMLVSEFWLKQYFPKEWNCLISPIPWILCRLPVFVLGLTATTRYFNFSLPTVLVVGVISLLIAVGCHWVPKYGQEWYYIFVALAVPGVCWALGKIGEMMTKIHINRPVEWLGKYSLEIYIVHQPVYTFVWENMQGNNHYLMFGLSLFLSFICAYILNFVSKQVKCIISTT